MSLGCEKDSVPFALELPSILYTFNNTSDDLEHTSDDPRCWGSAVTGAKTMVRNFELVLTITHTMGRHALTDSSLPINGVSQS